MLILTSRIARQPDRVIVRGDHQPHTTGRDLRRGDPADYWTFGRHHTQQACQLLCCPSVQPEHSPLT